MRMRFLDLELTGPVELMPGVYCDAANAHTEGSMNIHVHTADGIATITLNRPEKRNALSIAVHYGILALESSRDRRIRSLIRVESRSGGVRSNLRGGGTSCGRRDASSYGRGRQEASREEMREGHGRSAAARGGGAPHPRRV